MFVGKKGAWINQYAQPSFDVFMDRADDVDYIIIKYGLGGYEKLAVEAGKPWAAELMAEDGAGVQTAPARATMFGQMLAEQALQPGCGGAIINLEEADGGWHSDDGNATRRLIARFRTVTAGRVPLYASLDTRGNRPDYPYQRVCAELCDGVMPMVYPKAFGQTPKRAFEASITPKLLAAWKGKPVIPTIQTYDAIGGNAVYKQLELARLFDGVNAYTMGHATALEWATVANHKLASKPIELPLPSVEANLALGLAQLRVRWLEAMIQLAKEGTADEVAAFAALWKNLEGKGVNG